MNFLATSSFPVPVGPVIKILLSVVESFSIIFLTLTIGSFQLDQMNEKHF